MTCTGLLVTSAPAPLVAAATTVLSVAVVVALEAAVVVVGVVMSTVGAMEEDRSPLLHICAPFLQQPVSRARSHL